MLEDKWKESISPRSESVGIIRSGMYRKNIGVDVDLGQSLGTVTPLVPGIIVNLVLFFGRLKEECEQSSADVVKSMWR